MFNTLLLSSWAFKLSTISAFSILLPAFFGVIVFKKQIPPLKSLTTLVTITLIVELIARILISYKQSNLPLLHIYVIFEFALIAWMYQLYLHKLYNRYLIPLIIIGFTIFSIINSLFIQSIYTFNTYSRPISNLFFIIFAISYFYKLLKDLKIRYLERNPMFWINTGILIYYSGSLFLFIFSNYIIEDKSFSRLMWIIHAILNIFLNTFYTIGLWLSRENSE